MITEAELLAERLRLKRRLSFWRVSAVVLLVGALAALIGWGGGFNTDTARWSDHIARVRIEGLITGDKETLALFDTIAKTDKVKAVILRIDSPGGSTAGSEALFDAIRKAAKDRPVVAVMDTVAASGGYIAALASDHIVARGNTLTGSIGVIFQFPEVSGLLGTLGIKVEEIKSGDLKAEPSPYKPVSDKARAVSYAMVQDSFAWFTGLVAERRKLPIERVRVLSDGRVYTGRQALAEKLVDTLGGEDVAIAWLKTEKKLPGDLAVVDWEPEAADGGGGFGFAILAWIADRIGLGALARHAGPERLDGMLYLWQPDL